MGELKIAGQNLTRTQIALKELGNHTMMIATSTTLYEESVLQERLQDLLKVPLSEDLPFKEMVSSFENVASFLKTHPPEPVQNRLIKERDQLSEAVRSVAEVCNTGFSMKKVVEALKDPELAKLLG